MLVSVDAVEDAAKAQTTGQKLKVPIATADAEAAGTYNVVHRYLFDGRENLRLPSIFLVSADRAIVKIYDGEVSPAQVAADIPKIDVPAAERLSRALPFPGTFYTNVTERSYFQYRTRAVGAGVRHAGLGRVRARREDAIRARSPSTTWARST